MGRQQKSIVAASATFLTYTSRGPQGPRDHTPMKKLKEVRRSLLLRPTQIIMGHQQHTDPLASSETVIPSFLASFLPLDSHHSSPGRL